MTDGWWLVCVGRQMNADMVEAAVKQLRLQGYEEDEEEEGGAESVVLRKGQTRVQVRKKRSMRGCRCHPVRVAPLQPLRLSRLALH